MDQSAETNVVSISEKSMRAPNPLLEELKADVIIQAGMAMERDRQNIAVKLRNCRKQAKLTQAEVAEALGTTQKQISRMESCTHTAGDVTLGMISRYATVCKMSLVVDLEPAEPKVVVIESQS